ncbi:hypothetical protein AcV7_006420 [Taiwanofungus camphoratus]|nr:hypothetical protein AcV7_006420 [Antrodia cinnamomea]
MVAQLSDVAGKSFDYVVIGGGTAGLVVASHLVEDPNTSVLVLEAGEPNIDDPKILLGGGFGSTFGDPKVRLFLGFAIALHLLQDSSAS